jgi:hypothetical protein
MKICEEPDFVCPLPPLSPPMNLCVTGHRREIVNRHRRETHQRGLARARGVYTCDRRGGIAWPTPPRRPVAVHSRGDRGAIRRSFPFFSAGPTKHTTARRVTRFSNSGSYQTVDLSYVVKAV